MEKCKFCQIVSGKLPSHKVWEDDSFYAFLSIYPNCEGLTLIVPKQQYPSDIFELPNNVASDLVSAARLVAHKIEAAYEDVGRVGLIFEGYGVNHVHAKLYPMHGTGQSEWQPRSFDSDKYFDEYEGYLSTHEAPRENDNKLAEVATKIRGD
jgi:diadenosine tetraphosphate (Ap4A) HIT family hydrolase